MIKEANAEPVMVQEFLTKTNQPRKGLFFKEKIMHFSICRLNNRHQISVCYQGKRIKGITTTRKAAFRLIFQIIREEF